MDTTSVFAPITKMAPQDDGSLLVHGKATGSDLDLDQQRCDSEWLSRAVPEWFKVGNIREQHDGRRAVGKATEHDVRDDGHYITAKIVDPVAVAKAKAGIFTGFSIGIKNPRIAKSADAPGGVITDGRIIEVSVVDSPCLPTATLTLMKSATPGMELDAADYDEATGLVRCEELVETPDTAEKGTVADEALTESAVKALDATETAVDGMTVTLADALPADQVEKLAAAAEPAELPESAEAPVVAEPAAEKTADAEPPDNGGTDDVAPVFDVDAAKALVDSMLTKAEGDEDVMDLAPVAAPSDEVVASVAISLIAGLIQSEAQGMVDNPDEDCDIKCLLNAVAALRWFIRRERQETGAGGQGDASPYAYMAAEADDKPTAEPVVEKTAEPEVEAPAEQAPAAAPDPDTTKTTDPDTAKAAVVEDADQPAPGIDGDALIKALTAALTKSDNPLRKTFQDIVTASTETTAEAVSELTARLVKVENMAVPGGPALRRTEQERTNARRNDLVSEVLRFKSLAANATDVDLRTGYATKAAQLETELKTL